MAALTDQEFESELRRRLAYPVDRVCVHAVGSSVNQLGHLNVLEYSRSWGCSGQMHEILSMLAAMKTSTDRMVAVVLKRHCEDNGLDYPKHLASLHDFIQTLQAEGNTLSGSAVYVDLGKCQHGTQDGLLGNKAP